MPRRGNQRKSDLKLYWATIRKKGKEPWEYWVSESKFHELTVKLNSLIRLWQFRNPQKVRLNSLKQRAKQKAEGRIRDRSSEKTKQYTEKRRPYKRAYENRRMKTDPLYRLKKIVRKRIRNYLKSAGLKKCHKTFDMVGCTVQHLKIHIENQFEAGMTWDRPLEFHIDHIIPLAKATTHEQLISLCHYKNLQPLWAFDNQSKGAKILPPKKIICPTQNSQFPNRKIHSFAPQPRSVSSSALSHAP